MATSAAWWCSHRVPQGRTEYRVVGYKSLTGSSGVWSLLMVVSGDRTLGRVDQNETNQGGYYIAGAAFMRPPLVTGLWAIQETGQETQS